MGAARYRPYKCAAVRPPYSIMRPSSFAFVLHLEAC